MPKSQVMPWNAAHLVPGAATSVFDPTAIQKLVEQEILHRLEVPLRTAIHQAVVASVDNLAGHANANDLPKPPKENTICGAIWSQLDLMRRSGTIAKLGEILDIAKERNWNEATTRTQYATWRRYHNIPAQQKLAA